MESEDADTGISGYLLSPKGGPDGAHRGTGTTFSSSEADGVAKALKVIRLQKERLLAEGLGNVAFFLGTMNVALTAFLLGACPKYFWVWQVVKTAVLTGILAVRKYRSKHLLYWLEYCWVMNKLYIAFGLAALVGSATSWSAVRAVTHSPALLRVMFVIANGPLAWSIALTSNALIFHSIDHLGALFIHSSAALMSWTIRWFPDRYAAAWPGLFALPTPHSEPLGLANAYLPTLAVYVAWWVPYVVWLCTWGIHMPAKGWRTVFGDFCAKQQMHKRIERNFGVKSLSGQAFVFMLFHALIGLALFAWPLLVWRSFWLHTAFLLTMISVSVWNGSTYYVYRLAVVYEKAVAKVVAESGKIDAKGGARGAGGLPRGKEE